jgi:hypothetical protein
MQVKQQAQREMDQQMASIQVRIEEEMKQCDQQYHYGRTM